LTPSQPSAASSRVVASEVSLSRDGQAVRDRRQMVYAAVSTVEGCLNATCEGIDIFARKAQITHSFLVQHLVAESDRRCSLARMIHIGLYYPNWLGSDRPGQLPSA
jgi:hypothetical protein